MQGGIEGAGADVIAVAGQLGGQPGAVDVVFGGVVQDVQPDRPALKLPQLPTTHCCRSDIGMASVGEPDASSGVISGQSLCEGADAGGDVVADDAHAVESVDAA